MMCSNFRTTGVGQVQGHLFLFSISTVDHSPRCRNGVGTGRTCAEQYLVSHDSIKVLYFAIASDNCPDSSVNFFYSGWNSNAHLDYVPVRFIFPRYDFQSDKVHETIPPLSRF